MNSAVQEMLARYAPKDKKETENALKEIVQELALIGLYRSKFFDKAAFYGGTALRILYGLPRFSEDLDFTLYKPDPGFKLQEYFSAIKTELASFGFDVELESVKKTEQTGVESAFVKANTKTHFLKIESSRKFAQQTQSNERLQIKFEVDVDPVTSFERETKYLSQPIATPIVSLKREDLFAGKLHALLFREWKGRVKGRDFYDYAWYVSRGVAVRGEYFLEKAKQSGGLPQDFKLTAESLQKLIIDRVRSIDLEQTKADVRPFVRDSRELDAWSIDYFIQITEKVRLTSP